MEETRVLPEKHPSQKEFGIQCGGVAQLGEHLICIQKVAGSIPVTSTNPINFICFEFGIRLKPLYC